jgi:hypothetical protein
VARNPEDYSAHGGVLSRQHPQQLRPGATLLGNMIGGISLVANISYGSIAADTSNTEPQR